MSNPIVENAVAPAVGRGRGRDIGAAAAMPGSSRRPSFFIDLAGCWSSFSLSRVAANGLALLAGL